MQTQFQRERESKTKPFLKSSKLNHIEYALGSLLQCLKSVLSDYNKIQSQLTVSDYIF